MIPAHIPERLKACVTTHRIMDDKMSPPLAAERNFVLIQKAIESMQIGKAFTTGDISRQIGGGVCMDSIRNHLTTEVMRRSVVTYKSGANRYYKRIA